MNESCESKNIEVEEKEEGATMIEYALLVVLIAIIAIAAIKFLGQRVSTQFSNVGQSIGG